jgi:hypothetical protein
LQQENVFIVYFRSSCQNCTFFRDTAIFYRKELHDIYERRYMFWILLSINKEVCGHSIHSVNSSTSLVGLRKLWAAGPKRPAIKNQ